MSATNTNKNTKSQATGGKTETLGIKKRADGTFVAEDPMDGEYVKNFTVSYDNPYPQAYSNVSRVIHNEHDVCIDFALIASPQENPAAGIVLRVVAQVFMPNAVAGNMAAIILRRLPESERTRILEEFKDA